MATFDRWERLMHDRDVRSAVLGDLDLHFAGDPHTLVVEELALPEGPRVDIAVVNGALIAVELKSAADTLKRLRTQADAFGRVFERLVLVAADAHLVGAESLLGNHWGLVLAHEEPGGITLRRLREAGPNPDLVPANMCGLLWRPELLGILMRYGIVRGLSGKRRAQLAAVMAETLSPDEVSREVRDALRGRRSWRPTRPPS